MVRQAWLVVKLALLTRYAVPSPPMDTASPSTAHAGQRLRFRPLDYASAVSFAVYAASVTVTPISLVMLARELGFNLGAGGAVEATRAALLVVTLAGSGWLAAHWGKVISLGVSAILLGLGLFVYAAAPTYSWVLVAVAGVGLGAGVIEALLNPLVQDLHPEDSGRYLNFLNAFFSVGVLVTVLGSGELLTRTVSWRTIMAGLGVLCVASGAAFLVLRRSAPHVRVHGVQAVLSHKIAILRRRRFWLFCAMMFFGGGAEGGLTFWSATYIQVHFGQLPRMGGIGTAAFAAGMIVGRLAGGWWVPQRRLWHFVLVSAAVGTVVGGLLPLVTGMGLLLVALFAAGLSVACFWPSIQSYAADRVGGDNTALFILLSCGGIPGFGFASALMGIIGERWGLNAALYVIPSFMAALAILALVERAAPRRAG